MQKGRKKREKRVKGVIYNVSKIHVKYVYTRSNIIPDVMLKNVTTSFIDGLYRLSNHLDLAQGFSSLNSSDGSIPSHNGETLCSSSGIGYSVFLNINFSYRVL